MNRRNFFQTSLSGISAVFISNAVLANDGKPRPAKNLNPKETFFVQPNLKDYKFNTDGTAFFQTKIGFRLDESKNVFLPKEFRISHEPNGYGTPAFYSSGENHYVFVSELFMGSKMNGWIYEYNEKKGFAAQRAFQHENMGWYAFWGKPVNSKPALYHFNYRGGFITQTAFLDDKWQTNRIYNTVPAEAIRLYESQINHPDYPNQANQFGFEWRVSPDGFYDFLKIKHEWEQSKVKIEKDKLEQQEKLSPTQLNSLQSEQMTRVFRNRQCLANAGENCGCEAIEQTSGFDANNLSIVKTQHLKNGRVGMFGDETIYQTKLGFYDARNVYREIPEILNCTEDALGAKKPVLFGDGTNYFLYATAIENGAERRFLYKFDETENWRKEEILDGKNWGEADFAAFSEAENPIVFIENRHAKTDVKFVKAEFEKTESSVSSSALMLNELIVRHRQVQTGYTNPFVPIYCEGDDMSRANPKPTIIYKEVAGTKIEIPNMPAVKTQNELGECRAFSLAALMQWFACLKGKNVIQDCKNPPSEWSISYFGVMMYTQQDLKINETFQPNQGKPRSMYDILENGIQLNGGKFILETCKPFDALVKNFSMNGAAGLKERDKFLDYLKDLYEKKKGKIVEEIKDCADCITEINHKAGLNATQESLKTALTKDSYDKFLYSLFFDGCKFKRFPVSYRTMAYPDDNLNVTSEQLKNKIIKVLNTGKPVLYPHLCLIFNRVNTCEEGHSIVIVGYKKVCTKGSNIDCKDVFKVHNSWGEEWQKMNNDGWVDADLIVNRVYKNEKRENDSVLSASALWLD